MGQILGGKMIKLLVLGHPNAGQNLLTQMLTPQQNPMKTDTLNYFQFAANKDTHFDIWELNGDLPHLWNHHFVNAQAIVYVVDYNRV